MHALAYVEVCSQEPGQLWLIVREIVCDVFKLLFTDGIIYIQGE